MSAQRWNAILSRISRHDADDIDDVLAPFDPRRSPHGRNVFPEIDAVLMPQTEMKRHDAVCIGFRVRSHLPDAADRAIRLAAFAMERDADVVVLAHCESTGLERYGFRCERIDGETETAREVCEDQVRRFWNIDLVL